MVNKKTFLFIQKYMYYGGIEVYLYNIMLNLSANGHRIIWIQPKGCKIDNSFENELCSLKIETITIDFSKLMWISKLDLNFNKDEHVFAITFNLFYFVFLEMIKIKYKNIFIDDFFWVPHFTGKNVYIETNVPYPFRYFVKKYIGIIYKNMEMNDNIIYVNQTHLNSFSNTYKIKINNESKKIFRCTAANAPPYDNDLAIKRAKRDEFNIITVGRFSFPHKAYLLGLISTYGKLKDKYPQLKLLIIGYGEDEDKVLSEISKLSDVAKKDINLIGKVSYHTLRDYFDISHLNIGVASSIRDGALAGLISIPVRHYCYDCEGYGYLPFSRCKTVSSDQGKPIALYIEEVINMDDLTYMEFCKKSFDTYDTRLYGDAASELLAMKNKNCGQVLSLIHITVIMLVFKIVKTTSFLNKRVKKYYNKFVFLHKNTNTKWFN